MIQINLNKAKTIAHEIRRDARAEEFKPYDELIAKQIPGADAVAAESARQAIRDKYATIQSEIDGASNVDALKQIVETMKKAE